MPTRIISQIPLAESEIAKKVDTLELSSASVITSQSNAIDIFDFINLNSAQKTVYSQLDTLFTNSPYGASQQQVNGYVTIEIFSKSKTFSSTDWNLASSYANNAIVKKYTNNTSSYFQSNAIIPINTAFVIGTTGQTWRAFNEHQCLYIRWNDQSKRFSGNVSITGNQANGDPIYSIQWVEVDTFEKEEFTGSQIDLLTYATSKSKIITFASGVQFINSPYPNDSGQSYATINYQVELSIIDNQNNTFLLKWIDTNKKHYFGYISTTPSLAIVWQSANIEDLTILADELIWIPAYQKFTNVTGTSLTLTQNENTTESIKPSVSNTSDVLSGDVVVLDSNKQIVRIKPGFLSPQYDLIARKVGTSITLGYLKNGAFVAQIPDATTKDDIVIWFNHKIKRKDTPNNYEPFPESLSAMLSLESITSDKKYAKEIYVDPTNGDDTYGSGSYQKPFKTIAQALSIATNSGNAIFLCCDTITENFTLNKLNLDIIGKSPRGICYINGIITVSSASSSNGIYNIMCNNIIHSGAGGLYLRVLTTNGLSKTGNGYLESNDCDLQGNLTNPISITGAGIAYLINSKIPSCTVNNASSYLIISNAKDLYSQTLTAGYLAINNSTVKSLSNGTNAITTAAGSILTLQNTNILKPDLSGPERINIATGSFYDFRGVSFDEANSVLNGTNLNTTIYYNSVKTYNKSTFNGIDNKGVSQYSNILTIADKPTGGAIGFNTTTVDKYSIIKINQTTPNQSLILPNPSALSTIGKWTILSGSVSFIINNYTLPANSSVDFIWNGSDYITEKLVINPSLRSVLSSTISNPPSSPSIGDSYIVPSGATGVWSSNVNSIATFTQSGWIYYTPLDQDNVIITTGTDAGWVATYSTGTSSWTIAITGAQAEFGESILGSAVTVTGITNSSTATNIMDFTLPSAGVWEVNYIVRAQKEQNFAMECGLYSGGTLIANSELICAYLLSGGAATGTGCIRITTTGSQSISLKAWASVSNAVVYSDFNGRTSVKWKKISGLLPISTLPAYTEWTAFTPVIKGSITDPSFTYTTNHSAYMVIGKTLHIKINLSGTWNSGGSGTRYIVLPNSYTINSTLCNTTGIYRDIVGYGGLNDSSYTNTSATVLIYSSNAVYIKAVGDSTSSLVWSNSWFSGALPNINISIPIN